MRLLNVRQSYNELEILFYDINKHNNNIPAAKLCQSLKTHRHTSSLSSSSSSAIYLSICLSVSSIYIWTTKQSPVFSLFFSIYYCSMFRSVPKPIPCSTSSLKTKHKVIRVDSSRNILIKCSSSTVIALKRKGYNCSKFYCYYCLMWKQLE